MRFLFIDDDEGFRDLATDAMKIHGVDFMCAPSWEEAEKSLDEFKPTHVFVDIFMPKMSGIEFVKKHQDYDGKFYLITTDFDREQVVDELNSGPIFFNGTINKSSFIAGIRAVVQSVQRLYA